jgi:Mn-dependent DtxR family transcriptional regulator
MEFNKTQKKMLQALASRDSEIKVKDLADKIGVSRQTVSKHKSELVKAGIIDETEKQATWLKLSEAASTEAAGILSSVVDSNIIEGTRIDNATTDISYPERKGSPAGNDEIFYRATAYRSQGINSLLDESIEIKDKNPSIREVFDKVLVKIEKRVEYKLKEKGLEIYEELLEEFEVRPQLQEVDKNKEQLVEAFVKASRKPVQITDKSKFSTEKSDNSSPKSILLQYKPYLIRELGGNPDKAKEVIKSNLMGEGTRTVESIKEDLDKLYEHLGSSYKDESIFLEKLLERIEEERQGDLMITVTKNLAGVPHFQSDFKFEEELE